jgi:pSer/pThr/pTyr-binding forkhead associated (FHA) protein
MAVGPALTKGDTVFPLNKVTNTIGRKDRITNVVPEVDLATVDQDRAVSRKHAEVTYRAGKMMLRDLGSTNGTTVNGQPLQLQVETELVDADQVSLGGFEVAFAAAIEWPEGVEAEWPPEEAAPVGTDTKLYQAEETAVFRPDETAIIPPSAAGEAAEETATAESELAGAGDVYAPAEADAAPVPVAEDAAVAGAIAAEPSAEASMSFIPCTNHPHLPAVALCPGCLDPFCIDDLPERPGQPLACNRCAGIQMRLGVAAPVAAGGFPTPDAGQGAGFPAPAAADAPDFAPPPAAPDAAGEEKKKRWPF